MMLKVQETRERLLDAAESVVAARGVSALSLDAVAAEAGVSKGGLLHHFRSKEALLAALVERMAAEMRATFDAVVAAEPPGPGQHTRGVIAWALHSTPERAERDLRIAAALLSAHAHDPKLIDPIRAEHARIRAQVEDDGLPPGQAHVVMAAADGLFLAKVFGLWTPTAEQATAMERVLRALASP
ncbi:TetR/AcrR family transcriptional regulator [Elioraea sp.]|uniref:TetR/AcrR family transcriptional regulator n=1 Tax=Elioraea sp. TaxID=2185103 RepID=UPI003F718174